MLALLLAPMLAFGVWLGVDRLQSRAVLPGLDADAVRRIELSRGDEKLVLVRRGDAWVVASAADAPGDARKIAAALHRLQSLRGKPIGGTPVQARMPLEIRLQTGDGEKAAAFWPGEGRLLPDGERLALAQTPALPLWPSAWSDLAPPRIDPAGVASVARLTAEGVQPLGADAAVVVAKILNDLSATGFVAGSGVDWGGAKLLRVTFVDGSALDLQQVPDGDGRYYLRLASEDRADVRAVRRFAFRVVEPLP